MSAPVFYRADLPALVFLVTKDAINFWLAAIDVQLPVISFFLFFTRSWKLR